MTKLITFGILTIGPNETLPKGMLGENKGEGKGKGEKWKHLMW